MDLEKRILKCKNIHGEWSYVVLPLDIKMEYQKVHGIDFWYNEEKKLLVDGFGVIRKVNSLEHFTDNVLSHIDFYIRISARISHIDNLTIDLFNNWYNNEETSLY